MQEQLSYEQQFRKALIDAMNNYLKENPTLEQKNYTEYEIVDLVIKYAKNTKITPMIVWTTANNLEKALPRPFYYFYKNRLGDKLDEILRRYPFSLINMYFTQEQFEKTQRQAASHVSEVSQLKSQAETLQYQIDQFSNRLSLMRQENDVLRKQNAELDEENLQLKDQLEQVLTQNGNHQEIANRLRQNLTQEIHELRDMSKKQQQDIAQLSQDNARLSSLVDQLSHENSELKANNLRLVEINKQLLKDKADLIKTISLKTNSQNTQEPILETKNGLGFFGK